MKIDIVQEKDRSRFILSGKIDETGAEDMKSRFLGHALGDTREVVFDFSGVSYIGSAGIGKLLLFYKEVAVNGGTMSVIGVSPGIFDLFRVLKLDTIFSVSRA
ncbi:MAG: anti-anti-sigma factor [Desulfococcus sp.]|nr:MAG: anti-anti-sigma factor [Desulfococcus sp.]